MFSPGDRINIKQIRKASPKKGREGFLDLIQTLHDAVNNAHDGMRMIIIHGIHRDAKDVWMISNNLSTDEEFDLAVVLQNSLHKEHYMGVSPDPEKGLTPEDLVDEKQILV